MNEWALAYEAGFRIDTARPSNVAVAVERGLPRGSTVLDAGCGAGRNSIFLARRGHAVDAMDIADIPREFPDDVSALVRFTLGDLLTVDFPSTEYHGAVLARVIQYLPEDRVFGLLEKIRARLIAPGLVGIGYNAKPAIRESGDFDVETFAHPIELVHGLARAAKFDIVSSESGSTRTMYVPYDGEIESYDVLLRLS